MGLFLFLFLKRFRQVVYTWGSGSRILYHPWPPQVHIIHCSLLAGQNGHNYLINRYVTMCAILATLSIFFSPVVVTIKVSSFLHPLSLMLACSIYYFPYDRRCFSQSISRQVPNFFNQQNIKIMYWDLVKLM